MIDDIKARAVLVHLGRIGASLAEFGIAERRSLAEIYDKHVAPIEGLLPAYEALLVEHRARLETLKATSSETDALATPPAPPAR